MGAVAAALAGIYFAAIGQQFLQGGDVFIIYIVDAPSAKTTLCLLASSCYIRFCFVVLFVLHNLPFMSFEF